MRSFYKNYKWRMIFIVVSSLFVILFIVNAITYTMIKKATERQLGLGAQGVAVAVSMLIASDLDSYRDFLAVRDINSSYYRMMRARFSQIKKQNNIRFIYTANRVDEKRTEIILDSEPLGSQDFSPPGDPEEGNAVTLKVFETKQPAILPPTVLSFGVHLGSSAPILDENNEAIGVVGVTIERGAVFDILKNWFVVLIGMSVFMLALIAFLLSKVSGVFLDPLLKDKLTGAYNKRYSDTLLQKCMESALRSGQDLSVLMLDLDHFKNVNDTYGHHFGDVVLSQTSYMIHSCLRKDDFLIRYGGEEFLVLLFNLNTDLSLVVAERIRKKIEESYIYNEKERKNIKITISIGVASLSQKNIDGTSLITSADAALYNAKKTRNAVAVA